MMVRILGLAIIVCFCSSCRATYQAPPGRDLPPLEGTRWGDQDHGDATKIRDAERQCLSKLSPRAVASAFRAVDEVADALLDHCTIGIVNDDPLVWHVWCGSDALFSSGDYTVRRQKKSLTCDGSRVGSAFECMGQILGKHLLDSKMAGHVDGIELVTVGSVDKQRIASGARFLDSPCEELQKQLRLNKSLRWTKAEEPPSEEDRGGIWNQRLSWCRAANTTIQLKKGLAKTAPGKIWASAIGAGTDWLDQWRNKHKGHNCPTPAHVSGEKRKSRCRDARRVDLFIRIRAREGKARERSCSAPSKFSKESEKALYCYSECRSRAAVGRNPQGYNPPSSQLNLLYGKSPGKSPSNWIVQSRRKVNLPSVRKLLISE